MSGNHPGLSNNFIRSGEKFEWSKENLKEIKKLFQNTQKSVSKVLLCPCFIWPKNKIKIGLA